MKIKIIVAKTLGRISIYSAFKSTPLGAGFIGTVLSEKGHDVEILDEFLTTVNPHELDADVVLISSLTNSINRAYELADIFRERGIKVVLGGVHASLVPDEAIKHADHVVKGEGEHVIADIVEGKLTDKIIHAPMIDDLDSLPFIDFSLVKGLPKHPFITMISTSRGCPYDCKFCSVVKMHGRKFRFRSPENVLAELRQRMPTRKRLFFNDDNFTANKERAKAILRGMIKEKLIPGDGWGTQVRVDIAKDKELLELLRDANCDLLYIGLESINEKTLQEYEKGQSVQDVIDCIDTLHAYGIKVFGLIVAGSDSDDIDTLRKTVTFCREHEIEIVQITAYTPLPGTRLYDELTEEKRILVTDWDHYDLEHVVYQPRQMSAYALQKEIYRAFNEIYSLGRIWHFLKQGKIVDTIVLLLLAIQTRRWQRSEKPYLDFLKEHHSQPPVLQEGVTAKKERERQLPEPLLK